jgi:tetratricopeptide (TPR) repeat protein
MVAVGNLAGILCEMGELSEAETLSNAYEQLARETANPFNLAMALRNRGGICLALGDVAKARHVLETALSMTRELGLTWLEASANFALAQVADEEDDLSRALTHAERALEMIRAIGHELELGNSLMQVGTLLRRMGRSDEAKIMLLEALQVATTQGKDESVALSLAMLADLPGGSVEAARSAAERCPIRAATRHAYFLLWEASRDPSDLERAFALLDQECRGTPAEGQVVQPALRAVDREILAAWAEHGPGVATAAPESETRAR